MNRTWESGSCGHLFASVVIHPELPPGQLMSLTILSGLAVYRALNSMDIPDLSLKWPNDVLIKARKVCGILCETVRTAEKVAVVAGIGMNLGGDETQYSSEIQGRVTTIEQAAGRRPGRDEILELVLHELERVLVEAYQGGCAPLFHEWERCSSSGGKKVLFKHHEAAVEGRILGLNEMGNLLVEKDDGEIVPVVSGEIVYI